MFSPLFTCAFHRLSLFVHWKKTAVSANTYRCMYDNKPINHIKLFTFNYKNCRLLNTYKKIHKFIDVISHFSTRDWDFRVDNVQSLWSRMSTMDKNEFFFDMCQLDWDFYLQQYFRGIRKYLLNDPLETIPKALVKWNR